MPKQVKEDAWIPIQLTKDLVVDNLAHGEGDYLKAMKDAGFKHIEIKRIPANHKIGADYPHKDAIDLNACIVRARLG